LSCAFSKKNKHNSIINIYFNYKIVVNSPELGFGIKRQCTKVGCKNLCFLAIKIIYEDPPEMEKHFYKTIYNITLCNLWHRS
jgi:hypothetical protein